MLIVRIQVVIVAGGQGSLALSGARLTSPTGLQMPLCNQGLQLADRFRPMTPRLRSWSAEYYMLLLLLLLLVILLLLL